MSTAITIDLSDYLYECAEALENDGYLVFENDCEVQKYYENNFNTGLSDLAEYVSEMEKNLYICSHKEFKSYEDIYRDLKNILEENK